MARDKRLKKMEQGDNIDPALLCSNMHFDAKEAYKLLRTNVMFTLPDNNGKCRVVGITSSIRGEGKSTCAINLAYTFAQTGARVLLIDMDMRLPSISKKLNVNPTYGLGLSDYLIGNAAKEQIVFNIDNYKNWYVIFSGSIPPIPAELIGSANMKNLMDELRREYDYIIIDLPPVNIVSDALVAKDICDGFLLIVREGYSDKRSLSDCIRQMEFIDANVLGFVVSDSSGVVGSYGRKYGRYSKYYRKRKYGYYSKYYKKGYGYGKYGYGYGYDRSYRDVDIEPAERN